MPWESQFPGKCLTICCDRPSWSTSLMSSPSRSTSATCPDNHARPTLSWMSACRRFVARLSYLLLVCHVCCSFVRFVANLSGLLLVCQVCCSFVRYVAHLSGLLLVCQVFCLFVRLVARLSGFCLFVRFVARLSHLSLVCHCFHSYVNWSIICQSAAVSSALLCHFFFLCLIYFGYIKIGNSMDKKGKASGMNMTLL